MRNEFRLYSRLIKVHILAALEYKGWWLMVLQVLAVVVTDPIGTVFMFSRFGGIGSWTMERILLIYAMSITSFGIAESFCRGLDYFPWHTLRTGNMDRLLLRPPSLFTQIAGSFFHIHRLARPVTGMAAVIWCLSRLNIAPAPGNILLLASALLGGALLYTGVLVLGCGIAFFTVKTIEIINILAYASHQVARVPAEHMPRLMRRTFTFVMPMLVISYYPASVICGWGEPLWKGLLALPAGAAFLSVSLLIWRIGVRHYKSTGS
jgi:ABC-2 type transport system permease protein